MKLSDEHIDYQWMDYQTAKVKLRYDSNKVALWEVDNKIKMGLLDQQLPSQKGASFMNCNIKSLYLCVLDINGFRLGLFAFEEMQEAHSFGSNCLPSVSVESIDILNKKLEGHKIIFPITKIGKNWVAEFEDSEGNHIEMTTSIN